MKDICDNTAQGCCNGECDKIKDRGVNTGVTDTYGGGLDKGYQDAQKIDTSGMAGTLEYN